MIGYEELADRINREGVTKYSVGDGLGYLRDNYFIRRNLPMLNVLVVHKHKRIYGFPGDECLPKKEGHEPFANAHLDDSQYEYLIMRLTEDVFTNAHRTDWDKLLRELGLEPI